jgi:nucleoside-diphosphate-sugar epimerase
MYNNIVRSVNFINDCRKRNLPFIFISTNAVYLEDGEVNPQNTYGATKLTIEKYLQESYDADYQIFRLANPIGLYPCHIPYLKDLDATIASVLFKLAECKINNHVFHVHEMNEMVRDFVPLNFVAFMIYKRLTEPETFKLPIYPIGSNTATQIVPTLIELCQKFNINFDMIAPPAGVERGFIMNSEKILSTITGQKQVYLDLKTALQQYIDIMEPNIT